MIATVLLAGMMHQYGRAYVTCLQFVKAYFIGDRNPEITFDAEASKHATFGSEDYKYKDAHLLASPRTGEITIFVNFSHGGAKNSLPRIDPKNPTKDQILNAILVFRPTGESSYRKEEHSSQGEITFRLLQTIQGVPVSDVAVFPSIYFDEKTGKLTGFRCPPTEEKVESIEHWISPEAATSEAMHRAFGVFKGPSLLQVRTCRKAYIDQDWFAGIKNKHHRSEKDPSLRNVLVPAYEIQLDNGDSFFKGTDWPGSYCTLHIDASDGTLFGHSIWAMGGGVVEWLPAPSMEGRTFDSIKFGSHTEQNAMLTLHEVEPQPRPSGVDVFLYGKQTAIQVVMDRQRKLVWQNKRTYAYEGDFKF